MDRKQQLANFENMTDNDINFSDLPDIDDSLEWTPNPFFKLSSSNK